MRHYRRLLLLLSLLSAAIFANAQIKVEASETVELMAILSRMAGFREYCMDMGGQYTKDTEAWFAPSKQHPAVAYMKDIRSKYNIGYDAVMTMAINLETDGKKITMAGEKHNLGNRYSTLSGYYPEIVKCLNKYATKEKKRQEKSLRKLKNIRELKQIRPMFKDLLE